MEYMHTCVHRELLQPVSLAQVPQWGNSSDFATTLEIVSNPYVYILRYDIEFIQNNANKVIHDMRAKCGQ